MASTQTTRFVERSQFFNGQRLFASDLQALEEFNREMRWLHNRSLHQPGIGSGFAISGKKGDREVVIQPGYAIDANGREIVLTETVAEPVPPVADDGFGGPVFFDLTVAYPDDQALKASETRDGICAPRGTIRLREAPAFCWIRLGPPPDRLPRDGVLKEDVQNGLRLRLARAQVLNCQLDRPLSLAQRRNAKPAEQPYVACGRAEGLEWTLPHDVAGLGFGLQIVAAIETASAGFRTTPSYSAHVVGDREFKFKVGTKTVQRVLDGFVSLMAPSEAGFSFSLLIPDALFTRVPESESDPDPRKDPLLFKKQLLEQIAAKNWRVDWIGVEG